MTETGSSPPRAHTARTATTGSGRGARVATAAILGPLVLWTVLRAPDPLFGALLWVVAWLAQREVFGLAARRGMGAYTWIGGVGAAALVIALTLPSWLGTVPPMAILAALVVAIVIRALVASRGRAEAQGETRTEAMAACGVTLLGLLYPALLLAALGAIRHFPTGRWWVVFLLVVIWAGDIAAYYVGRAWGRHSMAPVISPKKTWEGAAASLAGSALVGAGVAALFWGGAAWAGLGEPSGAPLPAVPPWVGALVGIALNVAAQVGDLAESAFKRSAGVKDSGTLLPGHGGVLDRIDALLLAIPVLWYYLVLFLRF